MSCYVGRSNKERVNLSLVKTIHFFNPFIYILFRSTGEKKSSSFRFTAAQAEFLSLQPTKSLEFTLYDDKRNLTFLLKKHVKCVINPFLTTNQSKSRPHPRQFNPLIFSFWAEIFKISPDKARPSKHNKKRGFWRCRSHRKSQIVGELRKKNGNEWERWWKTLREYLAQSNSIHSSPRLRHACHSVILLGQNIGLTRFHFIFNIFITLSETRKKIPQLNFSTLALLNQQTTKYFTSAMIRMPIDWLYSCVMN